MTIILGARVGNRSVLVSDSAITWAGDLDPGKEMSAFLESPRRIGGCVVAESAHKLIELDNATIAAISGDIAAARRFVSALRRDIQIFGGTLADAMTRTSRNAGPFALDDAFGILVARSSDKDSELVSYDSNTNVIAAADELAHNRPDAVLSFGSISAGPRQHLTQALWLALSRTDEIGAMLIAVIGCAQATAAKFRMMDEMAGGTFVSAMSHGGDVIWQPDAQFVLIQYDPLSGGVEMAGRILPYILLDQIIVFVRNGVVASLSLQRKRMSILPAIAEDVERLGRFREEIDRRWTVEFTEAVDSLRRKGYAPFVCFCDVERLGIVLVDQDGTRGSRVQDRCGKSCDVIQLASYCLSLERAGAYAEILTKSRIDKLNEENEARRRALG